MRKKVRPFFDTVRKREATPNLMWTPRHTQKHTHHTHKYCLSYIEISQAPLIFNIGKSLWIHLSNYNKAYEKLGVHQEAKHLGVYWMQKQAKF